MKKRKLILENAQEFIGNSLGAELPHPTVLGEIVFNTSMTGYQEILTDPSYCDQFITFTYPMIGNYGVNLQDNENLTLHLKGAIVKEACEKPNNWRNALTFDAFLKQHNIPGISGVDTRKLTKIIRNYGSMKAVLADENTLYSESLFTNLPTNQISRVSVKTPVHYPNSKGYRVILMDFGYKKSILTSLIKRGCDVTIVPYNTSFEEIQRYHPQGILLSNGPGDPESIPEVIPTIQKLQRNYPLFAICMGHQLFALSNGAKTTKMKFGHRGANHPVKDIEKERVFMSSQNHGYAVTLDSLKQSELELTQTNLNDSSVEGVRHKTLDAFSVQYHPEANSGPEDTAYLFDEFIDLIKKGAACH